MFTNPEPPHVTGMGAACAICGGVTNMVVELPKLPMTDTLVPEPVIAKIPEYDQALRFCSVCSHGQLAYQVAPGVLYGGSYGFRTSASVTARNGTDFFFGVLESIAPGRVFRSVLDLGCNDLFLLKRLTGRAVHRTGIDPLWQGIENEVAEDGIRVIGQGIEDADLSSIPESPDLLVCRHTLEHIARPLEVVQRMISEAASDALFIFEVPGLETLVGRNRFDQVFHQHIHYFTQTSFARMLEMAGGMPILWALNEHDWGAFAVAFVKSSGSGKTEVRAVPPTLDNIMASLELFRDQTVATKSILERLGGPVYGYGAAQMLPVLAYHLETDLGFLGCVLDDDPEKDGLYYGNLPLRVMPSASVKDLSKASVLITAVDSARPILRHLLSGSIPRRIIHPFHCI